MASNSFGTILRFLNRAATLIAVGIISASAANGEDVVIGRSQDTAILDTSTADACEPTIVEHFTRYLAYKILPYPSDKYFLVKQEFNIGRGCFESESPATVKLTANPIDVKAGVVNPHAVWSFSTEGSSGEEEHYDTAGLYRVIMPGCCAAEDTAKYYSLETGRLVGSSTMEKPPLVISFPGLEKHYAFDDRRYITAEDNLGTSPQGVSGAMATLFLGDALGVKEMISITSKSMNKEDWMVESLDFERPRQETSSMVPSNATKLHVHMQCRCDSTFDISVPVTPDSVDIKAATIAGLHDVVLTKYPATKMDGIHGQ